MIGSGQIKNNAVKTRHIEAGQVKTPDLGGGAVKTGKLANNAARVANSSWEVHLVRNGPPTILFTLNQSANSGEGAGNGDYIIVDGSGAANVHVSAPGYSLIDTIRITQTVRNQSQGGVLIRRATPRDPAGR